MHVGSNYVVVFSNDISGHIVNICKVPFLEGSDYKLSFLRIFELFECSLLNDIWTFYKFCNYGF